MADDKIARKKAYNAAYFAKHRDKLRARQREWRARNPEKNKQYAKALANRYRLLPVARAQYLLRSARERAKNKGVPCTIGLEDILLPFELGLCEITGLELDFTTGKGRRPFSPSLHREIPSLGYVPGNVKVVVWILNAALGDWGAEAFGRLVNAMPRRAMI